ncbi:hypothetical protein SAMN02745728_01215 [Desulfovibrio litoralis DSM 11393]|uniref:Uncharacterized protein n=1 Tax=Desulfovibrio litoralis DSM 11393 TaxID=1121455 RepID=A0A1M7SS99_9BACT|nr:hypothetical protein [Desulfovibrio litoralis]SHN61359.1 hypothetical protein SAMN02745728_01215 [Desulfovibrio litoralis DSM 11393]
MLKALRQAAKDGNYPLLEIIGPHEFLADYRGYGSKPTLDKEKAIKTFWLYNALQPDLAYTSKETEEWLRTAALKLNSGYFTFTDNSLVFKKLKIADANLNIGFVLAPEALGAKNTLTANQIDAIKKMAEEKRKDVDLLVLISPWGFATENLAISTWLKELNLFDLLLGAGEGSALSLSLSSKNLSLAWSRSDKKGAGINVIDFFELPPKDSRSDWAWVADDNIKGDIIPLSDAIHDDPEIAKLIESRVKTN